MHRHRRHRDPAPPPRLKLSHPFARFALGGTVVLAVLSAGVYVFGPFSDLSTAQLAAGPEREAAVASAPIARLARRGVTHRP